MKKSIIILTLFLFNIVIYAQTNSILEQFLEDNKELKSISLIYPAEVKHFYKLMQFQPVWTEYRIRELHSIIQQSPNMGLDAKDYHPEILFNNNPLTNTKDSLAAEVTFTDAVIHFLHDIRYGSNSPALDYNGLNYSPGCIDFAALLATIIRNNQLSLLPELVEPTTAEYLSIRKLIIKFNTVIAASSFKEVIVVSDKVNNSNEALRIKLYQLGITDSINQILSDKEMKEKVKAAQQLFNLIADGALRSTAIEALNIPIAVRLKELKQAINTIRWLSCIKQDQKIIIANIPSANLLVYDHDSIILESRIIVGKRSTPTPTLCSKITEVILYPYWMVPYSIATKELLPSIKKDIGFLDAGNYQVINYQGRIVDPDKVDWNSLSVSNFPYIIRQSTGCDNALGIIKLNFYNPFSVYLHDTPTKSLFGLNKRYFSHGCMRVEKAMELGRLVLKNNSIAIDTLEEKGCLYHASPLSVPVTEAIPVFVLYNTAWISASGKLCFNEDIYRKNRYLK